MSKGLQLVKSIAITPAMLTATSILENDYPEWAAPTTYSAGERVIFASEHKIYESLQSGNVGKYPDAEPTWWVEVSATNRWKLFDLSSSTQTVSATDCYYEITPGIACTALGLLNFSGILSIRIRVTDPTFGVVYDKTTDMRRTIESAGWYSWFFGARAEKTQFIALDLPSYPKATIRIDLTGTPAIGVIVLGQLRTIGIGVMLGARVGIRDYSRKERNTWGDVVLTQRAFAKRESLSVLIDNKNLDNTHRLLAALRATPCLWIGHKPYDSTVVYGFYNDFEINIQYADYAECSIDIEGLT